MYRWTVTGLIGYGCTSHPDMLSHQPCPNLQGKFAAQFTFGFSSFCLCVWLCRVFSYGTRIFNALRGSFIVAHGLSSCGEQVWLLPSMWDLSSPTSD